MCVRRCDGETEEGMSDNGNVLLEGFKKARRQMERYMAMRLDDACRSLLAEVARHRTFQGFTGQTQTSYMAAWYYNGRMTVFRQDNWTDAPVRVKVRKGETARLKRPYEGTARSVKGDVQTGKPVGAETSLEFLRSYKPRKGCWTIVVTTGTEYSEILESVRNLDVLSGTKDAAGSVVRRMVWI